MDVGNVQRMKDLEDRIEGLEKEREKQSREHIEQLSLEATNEIWSNLMDRAGFDQVISELGVSVEYEIIGEIRKIIQNKLEEVG